MPLLPHEFEITVYLPSKSNHSPAINIIYSWQLLEFFLLRYCRSMLDNAIKELEKELKDHEKNPEKHPLYPEEWKTFWNRRYKELQAGNTHKLTGIVIFFLVISLRDT